MLTVTNVLGKQREARTYPDGSYNCPFCWAAVLASWEPFKCKNPACSAGIYATAETAQKMKDTEDARIAEQAARLRNHEWAIERIQHDNDARNKVQAEAVEEAKKRGACLKCLFNNWGGIKFIKHRCPCPKVKP